MFYNKKSLISFSVIMLFLCSSCMDSATASSQDLTPLIEKQELFEKKLNQIVKILGELKKDIKNSSKPSQANNQKKKNKPADPNKVHNIAQGNSYFEGDPNGKVVITEFFDFQ